MMQKLPQRLTPGARRSFQWEKYLSEDELAIESYTASVEVDKGESSSIIDTYGSSCIIWKVSNELYSWMIRKGSRVTTTIAQGNLSREDYHQIGLTKHMVEPSWENVALQCMRGYYTLLTEEKFREAIIPRVGKQIAIKGNRIKPMEFVNYPETIRKNCQIVGLDDRADTIFVIGLAKAYKEEYVTTIKGVKAGRGYVTPNVFNSTVTTVEGIKLHESLDWRLYRPHENVPGEVYCSVCWNLFPHVSTMLMKYVETVGPLCGVCADHLQIEGEFSFEGLMD